jgi:polyisoprenoid-binding protein YceI
MHNMKRIILALIAAVFIAAPAFTQTKWSVDKTHSNVKFTVTHLVISEVEGYFKSFTGTMTNTKPDFSDANIDFSVDVASINTDNEMRDNHLKSDDFFNAEKFPKMTFKSISMKKVADKKYVLYGELTIRDVTKKVKFDVTYLGQTKDMRGRMKAGFKATTTINRLDYNLKWNKLTEAGGAVVSSDVNIQVNLEFGQE